MNPVVRCPNCLAEKEIGNLLIAQSNQNVIFICPECNFIQRNIETKKG
ncbi:hypothetical protein CVD28_15565 [Bacillus sp. M6-12]|nr:hypothetical protein [Bacillus sp. M6-12]PLS16502.1 hypothetical protein CVD28_15565 [Bacillus sp. M6-12]